MRAGNSSRRAEGRLTLSGCNRIAAVGDYRRLEPVEWLRREQPVELGNQMWQKWKEQRWERYVSWLSDQNPEGVEVEIIQVEAEDEEGLQGRKAEAD